MKNELEIKIKQIDMLKAIEFWLNTYVFQGQCTVARMVQSDLNQTSTWMLTVENPAVLEDTEEKHGES